jgi:hypothetical protein
MDLYLGIAVVLATLLGPVLAVMVTRQVGRAQPRRRGRKRAAEQFKVDSEKMIAVRRQSALQCDFAAVDLTNTAKSSPHRECAG